MSSGMEGSASARLHGGWMEHKSSEKNKWNQVWSVLKRDGTLFFFSSQDTSVETHIGTLRLTKESSFHYGPGVQREGCRFDLYISKKKKKFKVKNQYDREMWRAYIVGVITGSVPQDVTLSPQDLQMITSQFQMGPRSPSSSSFPPSPSDSSSHTPPSAPPNAPGQPTSDLEESASSSSLQLGRPRRTSLPSLVSTGTGSSGEGGFDPPGTRGLVGFSMDGSSHNSSDSGVSDNTGGPFMHHKFDRAGNTSTPSWFFEDCNRELAEKIVRECRHMGNTLMRVSSSARPTGSYVITKRLESSEQIVHYEVIRISEGYTINAENIKNTMRTLSEVMDFFIQLSGPTTTHPMKSNNLKKLGVEYDAYHRGPILPQQVSPSASAARIELEEPDNYEVPGPPPSVPPQPAPPPPPCNALAPPPPPPSSPQKLPFNTWGKDKTGDVRRQGQQAGGSAAKTVGAADRRQIKPDSVKPSVMQVNQHLQEQNAVANLDAVLSGEERRLVDHRGGVQDKRPPLPAVPADRPKLCSPASSGYINDGSNWPDDGGTDAAEGEIHQRWNKRSQSVPILPKDVLGAHVPSTVAPPPLMKPGAGAGSAGAGGKIPPSTAPKTVRFPPKTSSLDHLDSKERDKVVPTIVSELRQKFQEKALQQAQQPQPQASSPEKTSSPPPQQEEGELYEDISQYYQNVSLN